MPGTVTLEAAQADAVTTLQDAFAEAVDDERTGTDAASPDYRRRWDQEQKRSDQRLRALIGGQAFAAWQRAAHDRALEAAGN
jgi:hypothetical protein